MPLFTRTPNHEKTVVQKDTKRRGEVAANLAVTEECSGRPAVLKSRRGAAVVAMLLFPSHLCGAKPSHGERFEEGRQQHIRGTDRSIHRCYLGRSRLGKFSLSTLLSQLQCLAFIDQH